MQLCFFDQVMSTRVSFRSISLAVGFALASSGPTAAEMSDTERNLIVQRACEAAIWAMPAVSVYDLELAVQRDQGAAPGVIAYMTEPMNSSHGLLTANDVTPYVFGGLTTADGPIVIDVPPAGDKAVYFGSIVNAWQTPIADVGPSGDDKGEGGKYLILPPGYEGEIPEEGYFVYENDTLGVHFAFRPIAKNGGTHEEQASYSLKLQWYPYSDAKDPRPTPFINVFPKPLNTLPVYDMTFFTDMNTIIQREPVLARDKVMMNMLAFLGIEKGKSFEPNEAKQALLLDGLQCAYDAMQEYFVTQGKMMSPIWKTSQWQKWNFTEGQPEAGFTYETEDQLLSDQRAGYYFFATYLPKNLGGGTFYLTGLRDSDGELFDGQGTYKLNVPADTPAEDFWSAIVYSTETKGFVVGADRVGRASTDIDEMVKNDDGSVDVYFAPKPPEGYEGNWIPTGEDFFLLFRLYGPSEGWLESGWQLPDVEKIN
jgi:hypothetical protein